MLKVRCPLCDELTEYVTEDRLFECQSCGCVVTPPPGVNPTDPYAGWNECYKEDRRRKQIGKGGGSSSRSRQKKPTPSLAVDRYRLF